MAYDWKKGLRAVEDVTAGMVRPGSFGGTQTGKEWMKATQGFRDYMNKKRPSLYEQGKKMMGYKKGGKVKKTGVAKVHKGERVLTAKQAKKYEEKKKAQKASKNVRQGVRNMLKKSKKK